MTVTAEASRQLRERTGAGMMECKKALVETNGDLDAAAELMRKQGLAKADKKASRVAAEGVIAIEKSADGRTGVLVEVNCETDFVARERGLPGSPATSPRRRWPQAPATLEALLAASSPRGETVDEKRRALIAKIGENIGRAPLRAGRGARRGRHVPARHAHRRAGRDRRRRRRAGARSRHARGRQQSALLTPADVPADRWRRSARSRRAGEERRRRTRASPPEIVAKMVEGRCASGSARSRCSASRS